MRGKGRWQQRNEMQMAMAAIATKSESTDFANFAIREFFSL